MENRTFEGFMSYMNMLIEHPEMVVYTYSLKGGGRAKKRYESLSKHLYEIYEEISYEASHEENFIMLSGMSAILSDFIIREEDQNSLLVKVLKQIKNVSSDSSGEFTVLELKQLANAMGNGLGYPGPCKTVLYELNDLNDLESVLSNSY